MSIKKTLTVLNLILLLLGGATYFNALAQTPRPQLKFDSLVLVNEKYIKPNVTKLKLLNLLADSYKDVNPTKGVEIADEAITLSKKLNNHLEQAAALHYKATNLSASGDTKQALVLFEQALVINRKINNQYGVSENLRKMGSCYILFNDLNKARVYFDSSLAICKKYQFKKGIAANLRFISHVYTFSFEPHKGLELMESALTIDEQIGDKAAIAEDFKLIGEINYDLSDYTKALWYYQKALKIYIQIGDKRGIAQCFFNIGQAHMILSNYPKALENWQESLVVSEQLLDKEKMAINLNSIGEIHFKLADYTKALECMHRALDIAKGLRNKTHMASSMVSIANVYNEQANDIKALEYYQKAFSIFEQLQVKTAVAIIANNLGSIYQNLSEANCTQLGISVADKPKLALSYYHRALSDNDEMRNMNGMATNLCNIALFYMKVEDDMLKSINVNPAYRFDSVFAYANRGLQISKKFGFIEVELTILNSLSEVYEKKGNYAKAYEAYKEYITLRDSVEGAEVKNAITQKEMQFEFEKKEAVLKYEKQLRDEKILGQEKELNLHQQALRLSNKEKELQRLAYLKEQAEKLNVVKQKKYETAIKTKEIDMLQKQNELAKIKASRSLGINVGLASALLGILFVTYAFYNQSKKKEKLNNALQNEKQKSDDLLLNILPAEVAEELKENGKAMAKQYNNVTVLFTDFVNFTGISEQMTPTELVQEIHQNFTAFDTIMEKHGLEKIKTIGDAYLAVCGLPNETPDHAQRMVKAAIEIRDYMKQNNGKFQIRIGIHSGPVVAGIVGVKKYAYDIWGDTVNTAARMESNSEEGKINVSAATYELIKHEFSCTYRGKINAKNKGEVDMYFIDLKVDNNNTI
ncbi:MAG: hypothetical protein EAY81_08310 [Bacteroidetes bacterium]|nr:MAG: hypothetical protein EAY81_08310 [Bacteroidota bacterium]